MPWDLIEKQNEGQGALRRYPPSLEFPGTGPLVPGSEMLDDFLVEGVRAHEPLIFAPRREPEIQDFGYAFQSLLGFAHPRPPPVLSSSQTRRTFWMTLRGGR